VRKRPAGRKLSGTVTVSIDIYQQEVGSMPLAFAAARSLYSPTKGTRRREILTTSLRLPLA